MSTTTSVDSSLIEVTDAALTWRSGRRLVQHRRLHLHSQRYADDRRLSATANSSKRFLPKLCSMEHFAQLSALTEPGPAGSDAAALGPGDAQGRSLHRERHQGLHIGAGQERRSMSSCCAPRNRSRGISTWWTRTHAGLSSEKQEQKLGWNRQPTAAVGDIRELKVCRFPTRPWTEGHGFKTYAMMGLGWRAHQYRRLVRWAAARPAWDGVALCQSARKQFGQPIATSRRTSSSLAEWRPELDAGTADDLAGGLAARCQVARRQPQAAPAMGKRFRQRCGLPRVNEALAAAWRLGHGYFEGIPDRAIYAGPARAPDPRGTNEIMSVK